MITHDLIQGTPAWLAYRAQHFNASDAPAMMGCSPYKTRAELLREMHTGVVGDVDIATQKRFDNGHRAEALARPLAEEVIGEPLYPVTGSVQVPGITRGLSASFDGLTITDEQGFEHKALNEAIRAAFRAILELGDEDDGAFGRLLPIYHRVQMEQQLLVSGAQRILFMGSEWTADGDLTDELHCWYYPDAELRQQIIDGWRQFERDLATYALPEPKPEPARAEPMESLPAVSVRLDGALVVAGNLPTFAQALREFVARIPVKPATDTEFATTEAACKALKKAEEHLDAAEAGALASITDVDAMRRAVADCRKLARDTRLAAEKMVERRKLEIKEQAVMAARGALDRHIADLNGELAPMRLQAVPVDFAGAIKGLRSIDSMQAALDAALANGKIAADGQARVIRKNIEHFKEVTDIGTQVLFADLHLLVHKEPADFRELVQARVLAQQERDRKAEEARKAAEAERIAAAERRAAAEAEARVRAEAEAQARREREAAEAEQRRQAAEQAAAAVAQAAQSPASRSAATPSITAPTPPAAAPAAPMAAVPAPAPVAHRPDEPATLKLGVISERLGFTVSAAFLGDVLHVSPAGRDRSAVLYRESQWPVICRQLIAHVGAMAELYAAEEVV